MGSQENATGSSQAAECSPSRSLAITVGVVGVVYGDIGTSPLYALREALKPVAADGLTAGEVLGVASLLIWALVIIVTGKYVLFLLRADNKGEGGILSLFALLQGAAKVSAPVLFLAVCGAALFFADAIITPAISVLSAVEGLKLITPAFEPYVVPLAMAILALLFMVQSRGTGPLARWFGPVTVLWFVAMGLAGLAQIVRAPDVLAALSPTYAAWFMADHGWLALAVLGAVFLVVTGAEALYADLGHFGRKPIQRAWFGLVFPALVLNYLGQAALVLEDASALENPFFLLVPQWALPCMVALAAMATVIASQAVITGVFSLTRQAIQLGLLPRFEVRHTSSTETGQIFLPMINTWLLAGVLVLVATFQDSSSLAAAYGIAVSGTMVVTTLLAFNLMRIVWKWGTVFSLVLAVPLLMVEALFLVSNLLRLPQGGYVPLILGMVLVLMMRTWATGTRQIFEASRKASVPLEGFVRSIQGSSAHRVKGTAVFLTSDPTVTPPALLHNLKHNSVLHEHIIVVTVETLDQPRVEENERAEIERLGENFERLRLRFGFMESPNINRALGHCRKLGLHFEGMRTSFFLGRRKLVASATVGMPLWQDRLFILMTRMATDPSDYYHLPRDRVVELGSQMAI